MPRIVLEVCVDSLESALAAARGGADRLEVCGNLGLGGGTTPSVGLLKSIRRRLPEMPLMAMVRPRTGDFLYSELELSVMLQDIEDFRIAGTNGVVFGTLMADGTVDIAKLTRLVTASSGLEVCFHRAFDMTLDPADAISAIACLPGVTRVLTSGAGISASSCLESLAKLMALGRTSSAISSRLAGRSLVILPGSGINARTIAPLLAALHPHGLSEVHMSGGDWIDGGMQHRKEGMGMGVGGDGEWGVWRTREQAIRTVRDALDDARE